MWKNFFNVFKRDDLFTQALQESHSMLDLDLQIFEASVQALRQREGNRVDIDIYATDKRINAYERDVRRKVLTHLAVSGSSNPAAELALTSIVIDIERIGDYAKNIFDLAITHPGKLHGGSLEPALADIEQRTQQIFRDIVDAFKNNNEVKARQIMSDYKDSLSAKCDATVKTLISGETTDLSTSAAVTVALYIRYLKRIAAHSRNIMTSVVNPFPRIGYREKATRPE